VIAIPLLAFLFAAAAAEPTPGPTVAREDTMSTEVAPLLVKAPRVTLEEILDRVARGEARRDSMIQDQSFRLTMRIMRNVMAKTPPILMQESVYQVYKKRPDKVRAVKLREWKEKQLQKKEDQKEGGSSGNLDFDADFGEEIVNFAFQPRARREFRYSIAGRDIVGNHLIYRIEFHPKSPLDPTNPSGLVWVDTNDFVIVRQEIRLDRSPIPAIIKGFDHMVVERQRDGDLWVLKRVLMRAELTFSIPKFGKAFDFALLFDDYATNHGIPDSLFTGPGKKPAGAGE